MASTVKQVLMLGFKQSVTADQQQDLIRKYAALPNAISAMQGFEWGTDVCEWSKHEGYTHCFIATFESAEARVEYLEHPTHVAFANELRAAAEMIIIFPFTTTVALKASC